MIIDFHVHCFPDELAQRAVKSIAERANITPRADGTMNNIRASMKKAGIEYSVLLSIATKPTQTETINNWSASMNSGDIIAFGSIHPDYKDWKNELKRIKELGLKGIKLHPDYQLFYIDEKRMYPIYESLFDLGLMLVFHAGRDISVPGPCHCTPEMLMKLNKDFKGSKIIAAHMGSFSYWDDVERYIVGTDIYIDTSYCLGVMNAEQAKRIILDHGYEKVLFASDSPWTDQMEEITNLKSLELGAEVENAILGLNALKLLGIDRN
ncbi:MAG: amidohydrolase family protein [Bacillota bacterium]|nr:amidohydrolase family protein [Bacillota bacterium]